MDQGSDFAVRLGLRFLVVDLRENCHNLSSFLFLSYMQVFDGILHAAFAWAADVDGASPEPSRWWAPTRCHTSCEASARSRISRGQKRYGVRNRLKSLKLVTIRQFGFWLS